MEYYDDSQFGGTIEEAMTPQDFRDTKDIAETQLFMTPWQMIVRRFFRNKLAVVGVVTLVVMALICFIIPLFYSYSESEVVYVDRVTGEEVRTTDSAKAISDSILNSLQKPNAQHPLGTNALGQDMLARLMYGGRISLMVGFVVVGVELIIGILLGGIAGYYGGFISSVILRVVDIISSVPFVPLMLIISSLLITLNISPKYKIYYTMFVMGFLFWTGVCRMIRGSILSLRETDFMQAASATGIRPRNQIFRHLIPNTLPVIIVMATLDLGGVILMESTLSFLGVGVGAPYASWGNMVAAIVDNSIMRTYPNLWVPPGLCILITVMAFNFIGDGLRDATDPRMKR